MRPVVITICFLVVCRPSASTVAESPNPSRRAMLFTDSSVYRAQCEEADTLPKLTPIPQKCTLRDQRVKVR